MRKIFSIIFISFFLGFLVFNLIPNEAIGAACQYRSCQAANESGCNCGDVVTGGYALWCCAADGNTTNNQESCRRSPACAPFCQYRSCQAANEPGCRCGSTVTVGSALWCCAGSSGTSNYQGGCKAFSACASTGGTTGGSWTTIENPLKYDTFQEILGGVSLFLFQIGLALAPVMLIIAGFMFVTAGGSPERVTNAKKMMLYTIIGLAVILLASGLIAVLKSIIGYQG